MSALDPAEAAAAEMYTPEHATVVLLSAPQKLPGAILLIASQSLPRWCPVRRTLEPTTVVSDQAHAGATMVVSNQAHPRTPRWCPVGHILEPSKLMSTP